MSDFLSNFDPDKYKKTIAEKEQKEQKKKEEQTNEEGKIDNEQLSESAEPIRDQSLDMPAEFVDLEKTRSKKNEGENDEVEIDQNYQKKQKKKKLLYMLVAFISVCLCGWLFYETTHISMPDFKGKQNSEAREWALENKMDLDVKQVYSLKYEPNQIIKQGETPRKKVKKGKKISVTISKGADPNQKIRLPDFSKYSQTDAAAWVKEKKAENLDIVTEYSDKVAKGTFIRQEIKNKEVKPETYRRKDQAIVYYSKGKETFEKNISVPDFTKKPKAEVETWATKNEINVKYEEQDSGIVELGSVISQSAVKDSKVAKRESLTIVISLGKAIVVPNFAEYTVEAAASIDGLQVQVKNQFSSSVPYGQLVSQSVVTGTKLTDKDDKKVTVIYSSGRPYLRSYIGKLEGDLPQAFYDDYQSKGASIRYNVYYVDSGQEKGTIVKMSAYNEYVGLDYVVSIGISKGNLAKEVAPINEEIETTKDQQENE